MFASTPRSDSGSTRRVHQPFPRQFLHTKVRDYVFHLDSAECVCFIGVDGQTPTTDCSLCCCLSFVLVEGSNLSLSTGTPSVRQSLIPTELPDLFSAPVRIQVKGAILFPRLPQYILLSLMGAQCIGRHTVPWQPSVEELMSRKSFDLTCLPG